MRIGRWHRASMFAALVLGSTASAESPASGVLVVVSNVESARGFVQCALFSNAEGFPMAGTDALSTRLPAAAGTIECRFENLQPGSYAVAVAHDANDNGKTDTNFVGIPKEAWGVSNGVRPRMRPPRFEEARFDLSEGEQRTIEVTLK